MRESLYSTILLHQKATNHKFLLHIHAWDNYHRIAAYMRSEHARINMHARVVLEAWPNAIQQLNVLKLVQQSQNYSGDLHGNFKRCGPLANHHSVLI